MTVIPGALRFEFVRQPGDFRESGNVRLDAGTISHRITMRWMPQFGAWVLSLATTAGVRVVSGVAVRDRVDCLLGVSTQGRPRGAIMSYSPKGAGDPTLDSFTTGGASLWYVPQGLDPNLFTLYQSAVV